MHKLIFHLLPDAGHPVKCCQKGLILLGEVEADVIVHRLFEKAGTGHGAYAYLFTKALSEFQIRFTGFHEFTAVHHDVIGALGHVVDEADIVQTL